MGVNFTTICVGKISALQTDRREFVNVLMCVGKKEKSARLSIFVPRHSPPLSQVVQHHDYAFGKQRMRGRTAEA